MQLIEDLARSVFSWSEKRRQCASVLVFARGELGLIILLGLFIN